MARVLMVIAPRNFRDEEYFVPKGIFEGHSIEVETASKITGDINGFEGGTTNASHSLSEVEVASFDAVVFVGGQGMVEYIDDPEMTKLAQDFSAQGKIVAAICVASAILANAKILSGKNATSWEGVKDTLISQGANYSGQALEVDGNIITANGPAAAEIFGEEILKHLGF